MRRTLTAATAIALVAGAAMWFVSTAGAQGGGTVEVEVKYNGAPVIEKLKVNKDTAQCGNEAVIEKVVVGANKGLANAVASAPGAKGATKTKAVIDQKGCKFVPHVVTMQPGEIEIKNSDGILHNINTQPTANRGFNISQPVEMETEREFSTAEVMIPVKCDVHGWMEAYIGVQDHPYAAVTGSDGTFTLENLPAGDYVIEAWHEAFGTQTQNVTVGAGATQEITFTYSGEMAGRPVPLGEPLVLHADHSGVK